MKILHISSVPISYPGGTEKVIWELATRQAEENEVTILQTTLYLPKLKESIISKEKVKIITCKNDLWLGGFGYSKSFKSTLNKIWDTFDIVHIHGHGRFTSTYALSFLNNKRPMIYSAQGFFHNKKHSFFKKTYNLAFGRLLKNANFCTALTELERKYLLNKFKIKPNKIMLLPGGIDLDNFGHASTKEIMRFKKKHGLIGRPTILYVGRIHESKGLQYVVEAIKDINCNLLLIGKDVGYKQTLMDKATLLGIKDKLIFAGILDDKNLKIAYRSSDIFTLFSEWEGFGIVAIEAMASKLPVIVSDRGSLPYLIKNNQNGLIVGWKNVKKLKEMINLVLNQRPLRKRLIKNGLKYSNNFDWNNINKNVEEMYGQAIKQ